MTLVQVFQSTQKSNDCFQSSNGSWSHHTTKCVHRPIEIVELEIRDFYKFETRRLKISNSYYLCIFLKENLKPSSGDELLTFIKRYFPVAGYIDPESRSSDSVRRELVYYFSNHEPLWTKENFPYALAILLVEC